MTARSPASRPGRPACARALQQRRVWTRPDDYNPALASFGALLPADGAQALLTALDVAADRTTTDPDDTRTKDQRRADALVQFGLDALNRLPQLQRAPQCRPHTIDPATYPIDHTTEIAVHNANDNDDAAELLGT